jgi:hypothetical protein
MVQTRHPFIPTVYTANSSPGDSVLLLLPNLAGLDFNARDAR